MAYTVAQLKAIAAAAATKYGVPVAGLLAQVNQESGWQTSVVSSAGAVGIAQFEPSTAAGLGVNPLDPVSALDGMAKLMATYYKQLGSWSLALAAYNGGPGVAHEPAIEWPSQTTAYVDALAPVYNGGGSNSSLLSEVAGAAGETVSAAESAAGAVSSGVQGAASAAAGAAGGLVGLIEGISTGWVKDLATFIVGAATEATAYVVLSVLGVALVFEGLKRATGAHLPGPVNAVQTAAGALPALAVA